MMHHGLMALTHLIAVAAGFGLAVLLGYELGYHRICPIDEGK